LVHGQEEERKSSWILKMSTPVTAVPHKKVEKAATAAAPKPAAEVKKPPPSMDEQLADIERKLSAKKAGPVVSSGPGLVISTKMREKMQREQEERELRDLENAINEEIRYGVSNMQ
jgi:hypothetical protein